MGKFRLCRIVESLAQAKRLRFLCRKVSAMSMSQAAQPDLKLPGVNKSRYRGQTYQDPSSLTDEVVSLAFSSVCWPPKFDLKNESQFYSSEFARKWEWGVHIADHLNRLMFL